MSQLEIRGRESRGRAARGVWMFLLFAGCGDPVWKAEGSVVDAMGAPVEGASVTVKCDDGMADPDATKTLATGRFEVGGIGSSRALGCKIEIKKTGMHERIVHMTDLCFRSAKTKNYNLPCGASEGQIELRR